MQTDDDAARRRELAAFLRTRRERLSPSAVGAPTSRRRRTPGLRREDVAELAGIGTAWYTWLEQARDIQPSESALRRIAQALRLDPTEERYLLGLVLRCVPPLPGEELVSPELHAVMQALDGPAYVKGRRWDLLAFNGPCDAVFDYAQLADGNILRYLFSPEARARLPHWSACAQQHVAMFRADCASMLDDPWVHALVDEMVESHVEFRDWWQEQAVAEMNSGHQTYDHPLVGRLSMNFTILQAADNPRLRLVVFLPDDDDSWARVATLVDARRGVTSSPSSPGTSRQNR
jgi:transcriptional regulator with XRE-family HTH domain